MPYLKREGRTRIYYTTHGPPSGTPLLLTHGYSSTSAMWAGQITAFTAAGYYLILWDMRGHGRSSYPEDQNAYSEAHTVADMEALLDHMCGKETKVIVGGLSLGGYMSQAFYNAKEENRERVGALLIIDTGPGFKSDKAREEWNKYANKTADQFDNEGLKSLQSMSPERSQVHHRNAEGLAMAARGMLAQRNNNIISALPNIKVPALVLVGANDTGFLAAAEYMSKKIQDCRKVVIPDAGHAANMDQPEAFNAAVLEFLESAKGRGGYNYRSRI